MGQSCKIHGRNECINNILGRNIEGREEGVARGGGGGRGGARAGGRAKKIKF